MGTGRWQGSFHGAVVERLSRKEVAELKRIIAAMDTAAHNARAIKNTPPATTTTPIIRAAR